MLIDELKSIKSNPGELKKFGVTIGIVLGLFGSFLIWREKSYFEYFFLCGCIFLILGLAAPKILFPFHKLWMGFAVIAGFFISRIILSLLFYIVMTPIGLIMRLKGQDVLDRKLDKNTDSYWNRRTPEKYDKTTAEKQF